MKLNYGKLFLASVLYAVIAEIMHTIGAVFTMTFYTMADYFTVWSRIMMPTAGPPPASFYVYSTVFALITGLILVYMYVVLRKSVLGDTAVKRGLCYGLMVFLLGGVPFTLTLILLINLPLVLVMAWAVENLVITLLGSIVIAKIMG